ncbi:MAG: polyprenyl diphosphate synthase [Bdellovibrio sp.]
MSSIKHVAIIMDGNGRWAQARMRPRVWGHVRGSSIVSDIVEEADDLGLKALTMYAFSTENWSRPFNEVTTLFNLLKKFLLKERERIIRNKIQFKVIGDFTNLPDQTKKLIEDLQNETSKFEGLKLTFAFGYGARAEIIRAVNSYIEENPGKKIDEHELNQRLYAPQTGDVDLLIRTGGDQRISNFLLWQCAYAELFFTETKWPDFTRKEFANIIADCSSRERRFGTIKGNASLDEASKIASQNKKIFNTQMGS